MSDEYRLNMTRMQRTEEYARSQNYKDAIQDDSLSYRSDIITYSLYCECNDCIKFCCYSKPIKCIDPYLMDMRYTQWIYHGLVTASKTASTRVDPTPRKRDSSTDSEEEPRLKRRKR